MQKQLIFIDVEIKSGTNDRLKALVDTGSEISIVHASHVRGLKYDFSQRNRILSASGHQVDTLGSVDVRINVKGIEFIANCQVVNFNIPHRMILGVDFLRAHKAIIDIPKGTIALKKNVISASVVKCSDEKELHVSYISWKRDAEVGPPPLLVRTAEFCNVGERERGVVRLKVKCQEKFGENRAFYFDPNVDSELGRLLVPGVVKLEENNTFYAVYVNFDQPVSLRTNAKVGNLIDITLLEEKETVDVNAIRKDSDSNSDRKRFDPWNGNRLDKVGAILWKSLKHLDKGRREKAYFKLMEYADVLSLEDDPLTTTSKYTHTVRIIPHSPIYSRPYAIPAAYEEEVKRQVKEMEISGVIEKSRSPYNSPLVCVKKDSQIRVVLDLRKVNNYVVVKHLGIPNMQTLLSRLGKAKIFAKLDLRKGFWQIPLSSESRELTAFTVPDCSHYHYTSVCFGLKFASAAFQDVINQVVAGLQEYVFAYIDDILIVASTFDELLDRLCDVLDRMRKAELSIKISKCEWFLASLEFLGHQVSENGLQPLESKVAAIRDLASPETVKQVRQVLGLFGFYRRFIQGYATIAKPLTNLLKDQAKNSNRKIVWNRECDKALNKLKDELTKKVTLRFPDFSYPLEVSSDASRSGLGGSLSQTIGGLSRPIFFFSRVLKPSEEKYASIELEALGIIHALRVTRRYTLGHPVKILTDCRSLCWLFKVKSPLSRIAQWQIEVSAYDFQLEFLKGKLNVVSDALSRLKRIHHEEEDSDDEEHTQGYPQVCLAKCIRDMTQSTLADKDSIRRAQSKDPLTSVLMKALLNSDDIDSVILAGKMMNRKFQKDEFIIKDNLLYRLKKNNV